eukprot:8681386-Pyramimonas_sp.AAC.1
MVTRFFELEVRDDESARVANNHGFSPAQLTDLPTMKDSGQRSGYLARTSHYRHVSEISMLTPWLLGKLLEDRSCGTDCVCKKLVSLPPTSQQTV